MTDISSLLNVTSSSLQNVLKAGNLTSSPNTATDSTTFDGVFNAAKNMVTSTNDYLAQAQQAEVDYASGKLTDTHSLAVIEQKANLSLQYTVAIKNQLLSAYKEIMNIQI